MSKKGKVFVGLSGGVDSSVSAALLKKEGYDVTGVFIKVWQPPFLACTWKDDRLDAMRVAAHLDIPFMTLDLEKEYKESVADYMIAEYKAGRTPNPDVMCNKTIKFGAFLNKAKEMGADFVATGHYARRVESRKSKVESRDDKTVYELHTGVDINKDQSYFLWTLSQDQLKHILFPVGHLEKPEVRKLAEKFGLPTAQKKDSQGLCFMGKLDMKDFLKEFIQEKRGSILDEKGEVIGYHDGAVFYTIGQRHGFIITKKSPDDAPYYIVTKDIESNTITVSHKENKHVSREKKDVELSDVNWIPTAPKSDSMVQIRIRYRQKLHHATIIFEHEKVNLVFEEPQIVDVGQSAVLYEDGGRCLGGGVIV